ncbi:MAG: hypothetical protein Q8N99_00890 [Nanoarchaeota archaeon]|nr:hypothetical protein [Nanoarchaeota archaeon]
MIGKLWNNFGLYGFDMKKFPRTYGFLESQSVISVEQIPSRWRNSNLILKTSCSFQAYVVKKINDPNSDGEIDRAVLMKKSYPEITPAIYLIEGGCCYTMKFVPGISFFNLRKEERVEKIGLAGKKLKEAYTLGEKAASVDISDKVRQGFLRYRESRKEYFEEQELRLGEEDFEIFKNVPDIPSHNDLNAENVLYNGSISIIDPSNEGYNDIARDIGRYCASCFFNNYDCFGNQKRQSLEIAEAFLKNFDKITLERASYYIGESFLSFLRFKTVTCDKSVLKRLATAMLRKHSDIMETLEERL